MEKSHGRSLRYFLGCLVVLSVITMANIVGSTSFLLRSLGLHHSLSLHPGPATLERRDPHTLEQSPARDPGASVATTATTVTTIGASASSVFSRTFITSSAGSPQPDAAATRGRSETAVTGSQVTGSEVTGSKVTGSHVTGSELIGSPLVSATTARPLSCDNCFRPDFPVVIANPGICEGGDVIDLLLLITTVHDHQEARQALRDTWLSVARGNRGRVRYAFLLGEMFNDTVRQGLLKENATYGDLLMNGFKDSYRNLTLKTMMGLRWAVTSCSRTRYVMKTDDDMWVNVKAVLKVTQVHARALESKVAGACRGRGFPYRKAGSKWHTSMVEYPQSSFPPYCSGTGYVTSMAVVTRIYAASPSVPFFYLEDVYVALCLRRLGLSVLGLPGFFFRPTSHQPCFLQSARVVTSHQVSPRDLVTAWRARCDNSTI